jgi:site-specific DNA-methyltransferase (adenine-specific)
MKISLQGGTMSEIRKTCHDFQTPGEPHFRILQGDVRQLIADLPEVHCVITSPPYYDKIDYGDSDREIGHEQSVDAYIAGLVDIFKAIPLHPQGSIWVNIGDKRLKGNLLDIPARFSRAMQANGFRQVDAVVWAKSVAMADGTTIGNHMPEPCRDRLNGNGYEMLFRFAKERDIWADTLAVQIPRSNVEPQRYLPPDLMTAVSSLNGRNLHNVWLVRLGQTSESHSGVFPAVLVERPIAMTCPPFVNPDGTLPRRIVETQHYDDGVGRRVVGKSSGHRNDAGTIYTPRMPVHRGWEEIAANATPGIVLDPFCGTGTTGEAALKLGRSFIGIELYPNYVEIARKRCAAARDYVVRTYGYSGLYERILNPPPPAQDNEGAVTVNEAGAQYFDGAKIIQIDDAMMERARKHRYPQYLSIWKRQQAAFTGTLGA